jgi:hypothetical protein
MPCLGIYPKACKSTYSLDTYAPMFITTLFTIAKICYLPRCPPINKQR